MPYACLGRSPSGRAIRCNLFLPQAQHKKSISAAIPNAEKLKLKLQTNVC
jgi:hypothetical protein